MQVVRLSQQVTMQARRRQLEMKKTVRATSVKEISDQYGISARSLQRAIRRGELPAARIGRRLLVRISDVDALFGRKHSKRMRTRSR